MPDSSSRKLKFIMMVMLLFTYETTYATILTLEQFRKLSEKNDPAYEGAEMQSRGSNDANLSEDAATDTQVFAKYFDLEDHRPTPNPSFQGVSTTNHTTSFGIQKQTEWGPSFSISQNISHTIVRHASAFALPEPDYYDTFPEFQATIPLWRNFLGNETQAQLAESHAIADTRRLQSEISYIQAKSNIETTYFTHLTNQESVKTQADLLDRAQKILSFTTRQKNRGLLEITDVHQAEAAVTLRKIDLETAKRNLHESARKFNNMRGVDSDDVPEDLQNVDIELGKLIQKDSAKKQRKDLLITQAQVEAQAMEFKNLREMAKPKLDIQMKGQWYGRDPEYNAAMKEMNEMNQPYYYVGIEFSMPLNVPKYMKIRSGLDLMRDGEMLHLKAEERDTLSAWKNFVDLGEQLHNQISLFRELEHTQKLKSDAERVQLERGRSTTFNVLTFEQEYISARNSRISAELEARKYLTLLDMFQ
jgi:outer membrane protein TolC